MSNNDIKRRGNIMNVRAVEDSIRASKNYTEYLHTMIAKHPIQGNGFPSRALRKFYEVYPAVDLSSKTLGEALEWVTGYSESVCVKFFYNYNCNRAEVIFKRVKDIDKLSNTIPGFKEAIVILANGE